MNTYEIAVKDRDNYLSILRSWDSADSCLLAFGGEIGVTLPAGTSTREASEILAQRGSEHVLELQPALIREAVGRLLATLLAAAESEVARLEKQAA